MALLPPAQANELLDPNAELVLDVRLDGRSLGMDILGYQRNEQFYISLTELVEALQFPINIDSGLGLAGGWYIRENREFALDLNQGTVITGDRQIAVDPEGATVFQNDIFVDTEILSDWFPINIELTIRQLSLNIQPTERLPLQARLDRQRRDPSRAGFTTGEPEFPLLNTPYQLAGHRSTDIRLGYSNARPDSDADVTRQGQYSLLSRGDLGWMTSTLALSGTSDNELSGARLYLERSHFEGPLGLNHVEVGDINPQSGPGGSRGALVRGGNVPLNGARSFSEDTVDLRGDILPDWEVELYRNGVLIESQIVGPDGQFEFLSVPLVFGENVFEFVFYGPFGEERREEVRYFASEDTPGAGRFRYEVAASQAGRTVFDVQRSSTAATADEGTGQYSAAFSLGISRNLSANAGVQSLERRGERLEFYNAGIGLSVPGMQVRTNYRYNPDALDSYDVNLLTRIAGVGIRAGYTGFTDSGLDPDLLEDNPAQWRTNLGLTAQWFGLPMNLDAAHAENEFSSASSARFGTTSRFLGNSRLSTGFAYDRLDERDLGGVLTERTTGSFAASVNLNPWVFRAGIGYNIAPDFELDQLNASARLRIDRSMTMTYDIQHRPNERYTSYSGGFNWRLQHVTISPRISYDSNERYFGLISISTSLASRPGSRPLGFDAFSQTNHGGVYSRIFIDNDGDGQFSEGDEPLPGVRIRAAQAYREDTSNSAGETYLSRLSAYRATDIVLDESTIFDADLRPSTPGYSVRPRPGHWVVMDLPMVRTTELEGSVMIRRDDGTLEPIARAMVSLFDRQGELLAAQRTAFDGLFLFSGLQPGNYRLELADELHGRLAAPIPSIAISTAGGTSRIPPLVVSEAAPAATGFAPIAPNPASPVPTPNPAPRSLIPPTPAPEASVDTPAQPTAGPANNIAPAATPAPTAAQPATGTWTLQLGAFGQRANAERLWQLNSARINALAGRTLQPRYVVEGGTTRVLLSPPMPEADARALCTALTAANIACMARPNP